MFKDNYCIQYNVFPQIYARWMNVDVVIVWILLDGII